jgi:hypothetical protein
MSGPIFSGGKYNAANMLLTKKHFFGHFLSSFAHFMPFMLFYFSPHLRIYSFTHSLTIFYFYCYIFIEHPGQVWYNYNRPKKGRYFAENRKNRASRPRKAQKGTFSGKQA